MTAGAHARAARCRCRCEMLCNVMKSRGNHDSNHFQFQGGLPVAAQRSAGMAHHSVVQTWRARVRFFLLLLPRSRSFPHFVSSSWCHRFSIDHVALLSTNEQRMPLPRLRGAKPGNKPCIPVKPYGHDNRNANPGAPCHAMPCLDTKVNAFDACCVLTY